MIALRLCVDRLIFEFGTKFIHLNGLGELTKCRLDWFIPADLFEFLLHILCDRFFSLWSRCFEQKTNRYKSFTKVSSLQALSNCHILQHIFEFQLSFVYSVRL